MRLAFLLLAGCATTQSAERTEMNDEAAALKKLREANERARHDLGPSVITPVEEHRDLAEAEQLALVTQSGETLMTGTAPGGEVRVAHVIRNDIECGRAPPRTTYVYAKDPHDRVRIVAIEPAVHWRSIKLKGSCALPGCGTQPPPVPPTLFWLPTSDPNVIVDRHKIDITLTSITCDRPQYPP